MHFSNEFIQLTFEPFLLIARSRDRELIDFYLFGFLYSCLQLKERGARIVMALLVM